MKAIQLFLIICCSLNGYCLANTSSRGTQNELEQYQKYVYKIIFHDGSYQTGFRVVGHEGIFTTLHGFIQEQPGEGFKNYRVKKILNYKGKSILNKAIEGEKNKAAISSQFSVQKVDWQRDLVFIPVKGLNTQKGFIVDPGIKNLKNEMKLSTDLRVFAFIADQKKPFSVKINYQGIDTLKNQKPDDKENKEAVTYLEKIGIPAQSTSILITSSPSVDKGYSGGPLIRMDNMHLVGYYSIDFPRNDGTYHFQWGIPFEPESLRSWENLDQLGEEILNFAASFSWNYYLSHNVSDCNGDNPFLIPGKIKIDSLAPEIKLPPKWNFLKRTVIATNHHLKYENYKMNYVPYRHVIDGMKNYSEKKKDRLRSMNSYLFVKTADLFYKYKDPGDSLSKEESKDAMKKWCGKLYTSISINHLTKREIKYWDRQGLDFYEISHQLIDEVAMEFYCDSLEKLVSIYCSRNDYRNAIKTLNLIKTDSCPNASDAWDMVCSMRHRIDSLYFVMIDSAANYEINGEYDCAINAYFLAMNLKPSELNFSNQLERLTGLIISKKKKQFFNQKAEITDNLLATANHQTSSLYGHANFPNFTLNQAEPLESVDNSLVIQFDYGMDNGQEFYMNTFYDNFPLGEYIYEGSRNAIQVINSVIQSLELNYSEYFDFQKSKLIVVGQADGYPYNGKLNYRGEWGRLDNDAIQVISEDTLLKSGYYNFKELGRTPSGRNASLAYLRAKDALEEIRYSNSHLFQNDSLVSSIVLLKGGQHRKVSIQLELFFDTKKFLRNKESEEGDCKLEVPPICN